MSVEDVLFRDPVRDAELFVEEWDL